MIFVDYSAMSIKGSKWDGCGMNLLTFEVEGLDIHRTEQIHQGGFDRSTPLIIITFVLTATDPDLVVIAMLS